MARTLLAAGAAVWVLAGLSGIAIGLLGAAGLQRLLPPLTIDLAAVGGASVAVSAGVLVIGLAHVAALVALRRRVRVAHSAAILLSATLAAALAALAAAAVTSATRTPDQATSLLLGGLAAGVGTAAYGLATARLVGEVRANGRR